MTRSARIKPMAALRAAMITVTLAVPLVLVPPGVTTQAATTELFISEYIEGSSFNKAIEIYNGTGAAVDLGAGGYRLELYSNGSVAVSASVALSGTLADGDVFVVSHGSANAAIQAQTDLTSSSVVNFNGDDGIVLRKGGVGGVIVDSFGQNGVDPGSQWTGGGQDDTLRRKATVCAGDTNFADAFDASIEWDVFAQDDVTNLGTHTVTCGGGGAAVLIDCGPDLVADEGVAASTTVSASDADDTVVAMTLVSDDVTPAGSLTAGTFTASAGVGGTATLDLNLDALGDPGVYTATIEAENSAGDTTTCDLGIQVTGFFAIHDVQGSGSSVAITGPVVVEGIVTSLFERDDMLDAFFLQEEDADADLDPATSEGIFVFCRNSCPAVATGDLVTVSGEAEEFFGMSQIDMAFGSGTAVIQSSGNPLPTAVAVDLPASGSTVDEATFENIEGMLATFTDTLVVSEYFQLARFGQIVLTESSRPFQFTHLNAPSVAGYAAFLDDLAKRRIILDDDSNDNNDAIFDGPDEAYYYPEGGLSLGNKFRGGDTIDGLTGVMHWSFAGSSGTDAWRVRPIPSEYDYTFTSVNPEPGAPDAVGGSIQVASFNVLNYFTTIDTTSSSSSGDCGPSATLDCRGADSAVELVRQRDKIVAAMVELDADILGLIEIENDADTSVADLVSALNAATAAGTYDYIPTGFIGTDAIKLALVYKPGSVSPLGAFKVLDSSVDPTFIDTKNRPVLIQTFVENATSERFTVAVNHLKSKGSSCAFDPIPDPDLNDGQANCNLTRTSAATALANYLATDPTGSGDPDFLIIGDLNAYAMEDPITALTNAGYTDLIDLFEGPSAYSFVFDGQLGYLDHALANGALLPQVTGVTEWHINADEVNVFDYNDDIRDIPGEASFERETTVGLLYAPNPLRSSDHDPLLVGLGLDSIPDTPTCNGLAATIVGTPGDDVIVGTDTADVIVTFGGDDTIFGGNGDDVICAGYGDDTVDGGNGKDMIFGEEGDDSLAGGNAKDTLDGGDGDDDGDGGNGVDTCANLEAVLNCEL